MGVKRSGEVRAYKGVITSAICDPEYLQYKGTLHYSQAQLPSASSRSSVREAKRTTRYSSILPATLLLLSCGLFGYQKSNVSVSLRMEYTGVAFSSPKWVVSYVGLTLLAIGAQGTVLSQVERAASSSSPGLSVFAVTGTKGPVSLKPVGRICPDDYPAGFTIACTRFGPGVTHVDFTVDGVFYHRDYAPPYVLAGGLFGKKAGWEPERERTPLQSRHKRKLNLLFSFQKKK